MDIEQNSRPVPGTASAGSVRARISAVIRTYTQNDEIFPLLTTLAAQTVPPWEVVVIDSGSALPIQRRLRALQQEGVKRPDGGLLPLILLEIPNRAYQSARALNQAIAAAQGELIAIISQDALPATTEYLAHLAAAFDHDLVAGAYGRQTINVTGYPLCEKDLLTTYPMQSRVQYPPDCWFVNTCSMIRRELWQAHSFDEQALISEDHEWAKWWQSKGYVVKYEAAAVVHHYHHYTRLADEWQRYFQEGQGLAYIHGRRLGLGRTLWCGTREAVSDGLWLTRKGMVWYWPVALLRRLVKHAALYWGYHTRHEVQKPQRKVAT
jgi:rhamnosyltransferase